MSKNGFSPQVMLLEGREQPGSILSSGLDASILAGTFLGEGMERASRPAIVTAQAPANKADRSDVVVQPLSHSLNTPSAGTIKQAETKSLDAVNGLTVPTVKTYTSLAETGVPSGFDGPVGDGGYDSRAPYNFYGGDFDGRNSLTSEKGTLVSESNTWDDVRIRQGATITDVYGHFLIDNVGGGIPLPTTANFYMRGPGAMSVGNCLTGSEFKNEQNIPVTVTLINLGPFFTKYELYKIEANVTDFPVAGPGHFYQSLQPNGVGLGQFFVGSTSGANALGQPIGNDDSWVSSSHFGIPCGDWNTYAGAGNWDVSYGLKGTI